MSNGFNPRGPRSACHTPVMRETRWYPLCASSCAGLSVLTTDADGVDHSVVIEVKEPHNLNSSCPDGVSPCLADGSLRVLLDEEETLLAPGTAVLDQGVEISAANLPGACRSFGFEKVKRTRENVSIIIFRPARTYKARVSPCVVPIFKPFFSFLFQWSCFPGCRHGPAWTIS